MIGILIAQFLFAILILPFCQTRSARQFFFLVLGLGTAIYCSGWWTINFLFLIAFTWWCLVRWKWQHAKTFAAAVILLHWLCLKWLNSQQNLPLPIGVSYVSFILLSALFIGVRLKDQASNIWEFLTTSVFFPVFTSGPVVNYTQAYSGIFHPLQKLRELSPALMILSWGLLKKALADQLSILNTGASAESHLPWDQAWISTFAIHIRLYLDFSGYSDAAIALGLMCGMKLPDNFNLPFLATSTAEFWRRWHMSLGEWIRHHFFMPMVSRYAKAKKFLSFSQGAYLKLSLLSTMMVIGIWHGLNFNFILWGLFNSYFIVWGDRLFNFTRKIPHIGKPLTIFIVFVIGSIGHIFFIHPELNDNLSVLYSLVNFESKCATTFFMWATLIVVLVGTHGFDFCLKKMPFSKNSYIGLTLFFLILVMIFGGKGQPFVYSRF